MPEGNANTANPLLEPPDAPDSIPNGPKDLTPYTVNPELEPWERQFAEWLAAQMRTVTQAQELGMIANLRGRGIAGSWLRKTKSKKTFQQCYTAAREEIVELYLKDARQKAVKLAVKGVNTHSKALGVVQKQLRSTDDNKAMAAARAAAPLTNPLLERVWPKREERDISTSIHITLSTHQSARLDLPAMQIEATEVPYEVVASESVEPARVSSSRVLQEPEYEVVEVETPAIFVMPPE